MQETRFDPWVRKIPWRRAWQPTPITLPREFHGQRSLVSYIQSTGSQRVGHDWLTVLLFYDTQLGVSTRTHWVIQSPQPSKWRKVPSPVLCCWLHTISSEERLWFLSSELCSVINLKFFPGSVQSLSRVRFFATPWTAACLASLSITISRSLPKSMSIESEMPSTHLMLCRPLFLLPSIFKGEIFSCVGDSEWIIGKILMSGQCPYSEDHCQGGSSETLSLIRKKIQRYMEPRPNPGMRSL